ncbi:MAG: hypothetical protein C0625_15465 [Arcobacter sp.]|nr:MAG: hypothetical protein C0625_15465 [Arcobacter sp.]
MSLKENVNYVKDELNTEEKFLEGFVKIERFYKKNKLIIIAAAVILIGATIGIYITKNIQASNKLEANIAFNKVLENPKDSASLNILKEKNKQLFQIAEYIQATKEGKSSDIQVKYLKELVSYQKALEAKDIDKLNNISMQNDFLLKEFAIFNKALILANNGKFVDAKAALELIPNDSKVNDLVNVLKHYLVTK